MPRKIVYVVLIFVMVGLGIRTEAEVLFVDHFNNGLHNWEHLGDGEISIVEDETAPAFGNNVLRLENSDASNCIAYLNDFVLTDGVITYLMKDMDLDKGPDFDADGPGFARVTQAKDEILIDQAFPTGYIIEIDLDGGFHILWGDNGGGDNLDIDVGIQTTGQWTWVKFSLIGNDLKGKTWLASEVEPRSWQLETKDNRHSEGAVAMRVWSGAMHVAHIRINDRDESYIAVQPGAAKLAISWGLLKKGK